MFMHFRNSNNFTYFSCMWVCLHYVLKKFAVFLSSFFFNPFSVIDSLKWKRPVLICCMDTLLNSLGDSLLTTSAAKSTHGMYTDMCTLTVYISYKLSCFTLEFRLAHIFELANEQMNACSYKYARWGDPRGTLLRLNESLRSKICRKNQH